MNISEVLKFDQSLFTDKELVNLQALADLCEAATTVTEIETAGVSLDERRETNRQAVRRSAARSRSHNALFKRLIHEVPRRRGEAIV